MRPAKTLTSIHLASPFPQAREGEERPEEGERHETGWEGREGREVGSSGRATSRLSTGASPGAPEARRRSVHPVRSPHLFHKAKQARAADFSTRGSPFVRIVNYIEWAGLRRAPRSGPKASDVFVSTFPIGRRRQAGGDSDRRAGLSPHDRHTPVDFRCVATRFLIMECHRRGPGDRRIMRAGVNASRHTKKNKKINIPINRGRR